MQSSLTIRFDGAAKGLSPRLAKVLIQLPQAIKSCAQEIRVQMGQPLIVTAGDETWFLTESGEQVGHPHPDCIRVMREDLEESFRILCGYSVHSHEEDLKNGFLTLKGGHRAGLCGTAVLQDGHVVGMREISSIHLRIARQIDGAGNAVVDTFRSGLVSTLICGTPGSGKTTILRDAAMQLANGALGRRLKVAVIDERGEIAATHQGIPQNRMGMCYILDGYPKSIGMQIALRTLSPDLIVCDEIGSEEDASGIEQSLYAGVTVLATAHAGRVEELYHRPQLSRLLQGGAFSRIILLRDRTHPCEIAQVMEVSTHEDRRPSSHRNGVHRFWMDAREAPFSPPEFP